MASANESSLTFANAAVRVVLQYLGYELDDDQFIDGSDRGIDAWLATDSGIDIFQVKTHAIGDNDSFDLSSFAGDGIRDLERARIFLLEEYAARVQNKKLKQLLHEWKSVLESHRLNGISTALPVALHLVVLGDGLTPQARAEFQAFQASNTGTVLVDGAVPVQFHVVLYTVNDIIDGRWREGNRDWKDAKGRHYDSVNLRPWKTDAISDSENAIFYCQAIDLVNAYNALGYQLFEPNVRANIKASRVNLAIRNSVLHQRTRRDFRFLNNGVTIICDQFSKPTRQKPYFSVRHPGVVNGLQTVVALKTAYDDLTQAEKEDFEKNCSVLVRLLLQHAVDDISRVVKATNNQNPMKPRNLVSNNQEQLIYARLFAEQLGWFYESKEGAWDAFKTDHRRWRPHLHKTPRDFQTKRTKIRRVDNQDLAQTWLAFMGFSWEAANERRELFDDRFYPHIFKQQSRRHGADYDFKLARAREDMIEQSPSPQLMLVPYLARSLAVDIVPSSGENRLQACERLRIDPSRMTKADLDVRLNEDPRYLLNLALGGMSMIFAEFIGYIFYRALEEHLHHSGPKILANHSFAMLAEQFDTEIIRERIGNASFAERDLLAVLWSFFVDTVDDMINGAWGQLYRTATTKSRFIFSPETRTQLYRAVQNTDDFMKKRPLVKAWAAGVVDKQGIFEFVRSCVIEDNILNPR